MEKVYVWECCVITVNLSDGDIDVDVDVHEIKASSKKAAEAALLARFNQKGVFMTSGIDGKKYLGSYKEEELKIDLPF